MTGMLDERRTVAELVNEEPARARVFERYGIDYCCGGDRSVAEAAEQRGVIAASLLAELAAAEAETADEDVDWSARSMAELADHIEATHHAYLRIELPRLSLLIDKVVAAHGPRYAWLYEVRLVFGALCSELDSHMMKEEQILFPICRRLDTPGALAGFGCGSVQNPIRVMEHEHDDATRALARLRAMTSGFVPPDDACNTFRVVLSSLEELEADLHRHIHKENNILFPRAIEAEAAVTGTV